MFEVVNKQISKLLKGKARTYDHKEETIISYKEGEKEVLITYNHFEGTVTSEEIERVYTRQGFEVIDLRKESKIKNDKYDKQRELIAIVNNYLNGGK